ncbi:ABC transporter substrate-binding protein [Mucilaginibacter auburnensis]|uniref:ABC transporter substrate-binding protein n=1 Tax=Mucilaginibacter auburnensis TaxID=1457233 RepID=UPI000C2402D1|nr:ABC transporter substrate-binding protein [Mucilaginibacter auburnensis]
MAELTEYERERLELIEHKLKFISEKPLVACINGKFDVQHADFQVNQLIELAGGKALLFAEGQQAHDAVVEQNADLLIILPEGGSALSAMALVPDFLSQPGFSDINAIKGNRVYIIDADIFNDEDMHKVDKVELLAEIIYPKQFIFGYEGRGWIKFGL